MTGSERFRIERLPFTPSDIADWRDPRGRHHTWPVVYLLDDARRVYVGETTRARMRLQEHLGAEAKRGLERARVVISEEFNTSACLDLESRLIAWFATEDALTVLNRNDGLSGTDYFERETRYLPIFESVFDALRREGMFHRSIPEIENLNLFKLSPFKSLNDEQLAAVDGVMEALVEDLQLGRTSTTVIEGGPGTGKTIVAIFLLKLLSDIAGSTQDADPQDDGRFSDYFLEGYRELFQDRRIGLVVPQQSLRATINRVFRRTPGLTHVKALSPYSVAGSDDRWDLLVVDETHRLTHRGSGTTRGAFAARQRRLFGDDSAGKTAIDWIVAKSDHRIFLLDGEQSVRPADVPATAIQLLRAAAESDHRLFRLESQMRMSAGEGYLRFARRLLTDDPMPAPSLPAYDLRFFDDLGEMRAAVARREAEHGLSRLVAGYAWKWLSKGKEGDDAPYDIEIDGERLRWNRTATDWIASPDAPREVGSVHTVQGYDLNYAGVIVGPDIVWDAAAGCVRAVRARHFDREVSATTTDENALLEYVRNAYYVLLTRGMRGTYVYVCDPALRERVRALIETTPLPGDPAHRGS